MANGSWRREQRLIDDGNRPLFRKPYGPYLVVGPAAHHWSEIEPNACVIDTGRKVMEESAS